MKLLSRENKRLLVGLFVLLALVYDFLVQRRSLLSSLVPIRIQNQYFPFNRTVVVDTSSLPTEITSQRIRDEFQLLSRGLNESSWILDYLLWHFQMRSEFPDAEIFNQGPNISIAYLDPQEQQGGLTDRMKGIGHILRHAYENERVLLLKWYDAPLSLESFLVPNLLNFTLPHHPTLDTPTALQSAYPDPKGKVHIVRFVNQMGNYLFPYGVIWHSLFHPSAEVQQAIDEATLGLHLVPGKYNAVHIRSGHPAYRNKEAYDGVVDKEKGFDFSGTNRRRAVKGAVRALRCSQWVSSRYGPEDNETLTYFYSDSPELVNAVLDPSTLKPSDDKELQMLMVNLTQWSSKTRAVGRLGTPVTHLENRKNDTSLDAYLATFVDLYIAARARCISLGVGRFAYMAGKISGTACWTRHEVPSSNVEGRWGMTLMAREVPRCPYTKK